ncbi:MAG: glycosyltransferase family 4 protein [Chloroflexi bacterium]|nr:glycosyltransferase family 4 protein [Chloroflexota bacterium]
MQILFLAQCYAPEDVSAAVLVTELAVDLTRRGHCITVVTGAPNYPQGRVFKGYRNKPYQVEILDGVRIIRTWSYISPSKKLLPRLLHYGTYSATAFYGGLFAGRPDVIVSYSPPLPLGLSAWLLSRIWGVRWVLQLEDLYPDAAIAAGVMKNKSVINFFLRMEKFLYGKSQFISVISKSFRRTLISKGVPDSKMEVIPVWADPDEIQPMQKENGFRNEHGLNHKFVVMYAGNIGLTSSLEDVLHAAEILRDQTDIRFVIVGEGVKKEALELEAREKHLANILFLPFQPREIFSKMLAAADINLVTINASSALSSMPSKVFNVMASARPILSVAPAESELMQIVEEAGCGWNVPPQSPEKLAEAILQLKGCESALIQMGKNGRISLEKSYSRRHCVDAYEKMLITLCSQL